MGSVIREIIRPVRTLTRGAGQIVGSLGGGFIEGLGLGGGYAPSTTPQPQVPLSVMNQQATDERGMRLRRLRATTVKTSPLGLGSFLQRSGILSKKTLLG